MSKIEVLDKKTPVKAQKKANASHALVPYRASVPALLPPSLGDIEAYIRAANAAPILSAEEEHELATRLQKKNDLEAAQMLVISHLRLVVSVARGYLGYGLPHADLIQEGNIGLMKAIKHYDPDRGVRLMTFAVHWIRSEIQDYILKNWRLVKIATTKNQRKLFFNLRQLKKDARALDSIAAESIAETLDVKPSEVLEMDQRMMGDDASLEGNPDSENEKDRLAPIDYLSNEDDTPLHHLEEKDTETQSQNSLRRALRNLEPRARRVIEARWLRESDQGEHEPLTLQELAKELGVSAERVRQIEKKALAQLRELMTCA